MYPGQANTAVIEMFTYFSIRPCMCALCLAERKTKETRVCLVACAIVGEREGSSTLYLCSHYEVLDRWLVSRLCLWQHLSQHCETLRTERLSVSQCLCFLFFHSFPSSIECSVCHEWHSSTGTLTPIAAFLFASLPVLALRIAPTTTFQQAIMENEVHRDTVAWSVCFDIVPKLGKQ